MDLNKTPVVIKRKAMEVMEALIDGTKNEDDCFEDTPQAVREETVEVINHVIDKTEEETIDMLAEANPSSNREEFIAMTRLEQLRMMLTESKIKFGYGVEKSDWNEGDRGIGEQPSYDERIHQELDSGNNFTDNEANRGSPGSKIEDENHPKAEEKVDMAPVRQNAPRDLDGFKYPILEHEQMIGLSVSELSGLSEMKGGNEGKGGYQKNGGQSGFVNKGKENAELGVPIGEFIPMKSDGNSVGEPNGAELVISSTKEIDEMNTPNVRQNSPKVRRNAVKDPNDRNDGIKFDSKRAGVDVESDVLLLPKELYNEIKAMGDGEKGGAASRKGISYKDMLTGASNNRQKNNAGKGTGNYKEEFEPSARANVELKYYTIDEGPVELIPDEVILERLNNCVVAYFLGDKLGFPETEKELRRLWPSLALVKRNKKGFFFLSFEKENDMDQFLENGHCYIFGRIMVVKKWHRMLKMTKEALEVIPVWVRFYDLPLEFWSIDNLSKLASKIGRPRYVDKATEKMLSVTYARVCIEIDASSQLPNSLQIKTGDEIVDVEVCYQWLPPRCEECKVFGHKEIYCQSKKVRDKGKEAEPVMSGHAMRGNGWKPNQRHDSRQGPIPSSKNWNDPRGKKEVFNDNWQPAPGKKRANKVYDRHGNVANVKDIRSKYVRVEKDKEKMVMANSFEVLEDKAYKQEENGFHVESCPQPTKENDKILQEMNGRVTDPINEKGEKSENLGPVKGVVKENVNKEKGGESVLDEACICEDDETEGDKIVMNITPVKLAKGLSVDDYPRDWSKKKIKREIKAKRNAMEEVRKRSKKIDPP